MKIEKRKNLYFLFAAAFALTLSVLSVVPGDRDQDAVISGINEQSVELPQEMIDRVREAGGNPALLTVRATDSVVEQRAFENSQIKKDEVMKSAGGTSDSSAGAEAEETSDLFACAKAAAQQSGGEQSPTVIYDAKQGGCLVVNSDGTLTPLEE